MDDLTKITITLNDSFPEPGWVRAEIELQFCSDTPLVATGLIIRNLVEGSPSDTFHETAERARAAALRRLDLASSLLREHPLEELRQIADQAEPLESRALRLAGMPQSRTP